MVYHLVDNYSRGWVVEVLPNENASACSSWLLLPAENLWSEGLRGFLYIMAMMYVFIGIAISSDIFMCSIEVITSKRRKIVRWDEESQQQVTREVLIWNETVANLTLMALGSSAPEILLSCLEAIQNLGVPPSGESLGAFTIVGSAAFNLLIISGICVVSVPSPDAKRIRELGVFLLTSLWSIFAYIWMLVVLVFNSRGEVEVWEAWLTFAFFPIMVVSAYCQDNGWWCKNKRVTDGSQSNVRVVTDRSREKSTLFHGPAKELHALEQEKAVRIRNTDSATSTESQSKLVRVDDTAPQTFARARFRHAAVRSMLGGRRTHFIHRTVKMAEVVDKMRSVHHLNNVNTEDLCGKFTFAAPSYSVLESAGILELDVLFHRRTPSKSKIALANGGAPIVEVKSNGTTAVVENETSFINTGPTGETLETDIITGIVTVDFETREGSAKVDKDFKYTFGSLVFKETEYKKTIAIPIIKDDQYDADVDFYVILKNPGGDSALGDPSVSRVTIIDDDEPGEFLFEKAHYNADLESGLLVATVARQKGCDGTVTVEYGTINGTALGGDELKPGIDYITAENTLTFKHGETSKQIRIDVNKKSKGFKNFIIALRNPSLGAKIGGHSAAVANISDDPAALNRLWDRLNRNKSRASLLLNEDELGNRIADVLDEEEEEEEVTWAGQFKSAMVLECEKDEEGKDIPLKWHDYLLHFLSFLWKVIFAFIPPPHLLGAWPCFIVSLAMIGGLTALVEQLGHLLGCVLSLKTSVTGITIVALGTSLPDTFASRTAALHDEHADAAIGNITGSNSVNVFLGLGLPWVIGSMYALINENGANYKVAVGALFSSVMTFTAVGTVCIVLLLVRRKFVGGELGGSMCVKWVTGGFFLSLWGVYIVLTSLKAYDILTW